jgi:NAD(P)-dependent dehydrogenase (short-subunit alcohol dehydrogenase family)
MVIVAGRKLPAVIDLSGRVVIVTGGNSGIGLGIARGVAKAGASVAIWSRRTERNAQAVAELEELGAAAAGVRCDVSDEGDVTAAMRETLDRFGRLDCLVANAGTAGKQRITDMSLQEWHRVLQVNLDGAFLCLREAARVLVQQGQGGSLVGVSSTSAIHGAPGQQHYAASKTALLGVMRALAVELARYQVRCNSLLPGWTDTELTAEAQTHEKFMTATLGRTPVRRWATPHDFETVGAFLADPTLTFHTGDSMVVDGGYTIF